MSKASRPRNAQGRFIKDRPSLTNNSAHVPGGLGATLDAPITVVGLEWTLEDASALGCPIGVQLAKETVGVS